jgi:AraC family transcriptional regulator
MDDPGTRFTEPLPAAISSLTDGGVATFDSDRDAARRYLQHASELLRAGGGSLSNRECARVRKSPSGLAMWQVNRVFDYVDKHLAHRITVCDLANLINVSPSQLSRGFKASVGVSPARFITTKRIELACALLRTSREPLAHVAISCGMYDQAHLSRVFSRAMGTSPAAWRRANTLDPYTLVSAGQRGSSSHAR